MRESLFCCYPKKSFKKCSLRPATGEENVRGGLGGHHCSALWSAECRPPLAVQLRFPPQSQLAQAYATEGLVSWPSLLNRAGAEWGNLRVSSSSGKLQLPREPNGC